MNSSNINSNSSDAPVSKQIIKVTPDLDVTLHDFPELNQRDVLCSLIGEKCDLYELVLPKNLYKVFGARDTFTKPDDICIAMLVDEEGLYHDLKTNLLGSYLYQTYLHHNPIVGTCLFVGVSRHGIDENFCGIPETDCMDLLQKICDFCTEVKGLKKE